MKNWFQRIAQVPPVANYGEPGAMPTQGVGVPNAGPMAPGTTPGQAAQVAMLQSQLDAFVTPLVKAFQDAQFKAAVEAILADPQGSAVLKKKALDPATLALAKGDQAKLQILQWALSGWYPKVKEFVDAYLKGDGSAQQIQSLYVTMQGIQTAVVK